MLYFQLLNNYFGYEFDIGLHPYPHPYKETDKDNKSYYLIHAYEYIMDNLICCGIFIKFYSVEMLRYIGLCRAEQNDESKKCEYPIIADFDHVERYANALYIFDIDDTVFYYEKLGKSWWYNMIDYNYRRGMIGLNANYIALRKWERLIYHQKDDDIKGISIGPLNDLIEFINDNDSDFHFITSRSNYHSDLTYKHLRKFIYHDITDKITFADGRNKGYILRDLLSGNNKEYKKIVFIDDIDKNLTDVQHEYPETECYKMTSLKF